jgi:hypothetical protein
MYRSLFALSGLGIFGWFLLIFFPKWRVTRRVADSAIFPAYVALIYAAGIALVLEEMGAGFMADFATADGVLRLLASEPIALVAWIHILAFDQVVAHLIYRDNMRHRFVPVWVQSILLFVTLMLGPLGFLAYWLVRVTRAKQLVAWGEPTDLPADPEERPVRFADVVKERSVFGAVIGLLRREPALTRVGLLGLVLAAVMGLVGLVHGSWLIEPAGRIKEAARFDFAVGLYYLTVAMILPLAGMSEAAARRWRRWGVGLILYGYSIENIQVLRGVDPRFMTTPLDQALGGVFFAQALGILVMFVVLTGRFFRDDVLPDHAPLRSAIRYAAIAANVAFFAGILMSGLQGRVVREGGDLIGVHAAGFHALQAVPLVALLLGWSRLPLDAQMRWVRVAGIGWLAFTVALLVQALLGRPSSTVDLVFAAGAAGAVVWLIAVLYAAAARSGEARLATS